jgi:hypothetical protein
MGSKRRSGECQSGIKAYGDVVVPALRGVVAGED